MIPFLVRRLVWFVITLWCVVTVSFFLMRNVEGGPFDSEKALAPEIKANIERRYHLDWPQWKQYLQYVGPFNLDERSGIFSKDTIEVDDLDAAPIEVPDPDGEPVVGPDGEPVVGPDGEPVRPTKLVRPKKTVPNPDRYTDVFTGVLAGDLGPSFKYKDYSVNDIIAQSLPISISLGSVGLFWALLLGLGAGILSAVWRGTGLDLSMRVVATMGIALPNFVIAGFLILSLAFSIDWLPVAGWGAPRFILLPSLALGAPFAAYIARLARTGVLEVLSQDHVRTARAKGLPEKLVLLRHVVKGGVLPVVSYLGPAVAGILTGSLVIEKLFGIPGTGTHFVNSALARDYTLAMGVTILYTVLVYSLNTLVDLAYTLLDPRIKLEES
ncbi:MAG: ABC transporter permease subunit [Planctomycetota bacterium]